MSYYNGYKSMPYILYNIIEYLAKNNENLWKILKYNDYDCLSKDNLTFEEKMELIWKYEANQKDYRIFFTQLIEDSIPYEATVVKMYRYMTKPSSNINAKALYEFDILYGGKISMIDYNGYPCNRGDVCETEILSTLNGKDVGGVGRLEFNRTTDRMSQSGLNIGDHKNFVGVSLIMAVDISDVDENNSCL